MLEHETVAHENQYLEENDEEEDWCFHFEADLEECCVAPVDPHVEVEQVGEDKNIDSAQNHNDSVTGAVEGVIVLHVVLHLLIAPSHLPIVVIYRRIIHSLHLLLLL